MRRLLLLETLRDLPALALGAALLALLACGEVRVHAACRAAAAGDGACSFSNLGTAAGAACVRPTALRLRGEAVLPLGTLAEFPLVCSGRLAPGETRAVPLPPPTPALAAVCPDLDDCRLDVGAVEVRR